MNTDLKPGDFRASIRTIPDHLKPQGGNVDVSSLIDMSTIEPTLFDDRAGFEAAAKAQGYRPVRKAWSDGLRGKLGPLPKDEREILGATVTSRQGRWQGEGWVSSLAPANRHVWVFVPSEGKFHCCDLGTKNRRGELNIVRRFGPDEIGEEAA